MKDVLIAFYGFNQTDATTKAISIIEKIYPELN